MLQDNETISTYKKSNIIIWMVMAFQGGYLNTAGFMACQRFVSHVTGYATLFPYEISVHGLSDALQVALVPLFFLAGAMISGYLVDIRLRLHKRPKYYISFGLMCLLITVILVAGVNGEFGAFSEPLVLSKDYTLLALLTFICGVQNGTITTVSKSVIRTTHLTGITTDLGIGLMRILFYKKIGSQIPDEGKANLMRLGIITFFILGSLIGFVCFSHLGYHGFIIPLITSSSLFFTMIYYAFLWHKKSKEIAIELWRRLH